MLQNFLRHELGLPVADEPQPHMDQVRGRAYPDRDLPRLPVLLLRERESQREHHQAARIIDDNKYDFESLALKPKSLFVGAGFL